MSSPHTQPVVTPPVAREIWKLIEPIHTVSYFSPESRETIGALGYKGYWMGYFAARSAPLGAVGAGPVEATFYNFTPDRVRRAIPDAWQYAGPEQALEARLVGAAASLRRAIADRSPGADEHEDLDACVRVLERCAEHASPDGRPLFAAQRHVPGTEDLLGRLWQAATSLREHRGDGHVAALVVHGITGRESHVFGAARRGRSEPGMYTALRDYTEDEWRARQGDLRLRGLLDEDGALTDEGRTTSDAIEDATDRVAAPAYADVTAEELELLRTVLAPISAAAKPEAAG